MLSCVAIFLRARYLVKPEKDEIISFLGHFNDDMKAGKTKAISAYFENGSKTKNIKLLVKILSGKTGLNGKSGPVLKLNLFTDSATVKANSGTWTEVQVPAGFTHDSVAAQATVIVFKIHKTGLHEFKIAKVNAKRFLTDYLAFEKKVKMLNFSSKDLFEPITLAAFKTAEKLKARYDSVLYFEHLQGKTFFFVAKGTFQYRYDTAQHQNYKLGLVNPDLKEIIPVKYNVIHNINGTIDGLIEVEDEHKKGFYNTEGKLVVPVEYEMVLPLADGNNLALLEKGSDYFYLKNDLTLTDKLVDFKLSNELKKVKNMTNSYKLDEDKSGNIMEYNSKEYHSSICFPPSYLVDWNIVTTSVDLPNHLRKAINSELEDGEGSLWQQVNFDGYKADEKDLFETIYYSVVDDYLGSRGGLYTSKKVLVVDNKLNKVMPFSAESYHGPGEGGGVLSGKCNDNAFRQVGENLYEFKTTSILVSHIFSEGPYYHYLHVVNGKLVALPDRRFFGFTKYVKMDDSYLNGCYVIKDKRTDEMNKELLQYAKNEIFADYHYKFKNQKWIEAFYWQFGNSDEANVNVNDSLTEIDKYNINWINNKLKEPTTGTLASR